MATNTTGVAQKIAALRNRKLSTPDEISKLPTLTEKVQALKNRPSSSKLVSASKKINTQKTSISSGIVNNTPTQDKLTTTKNNENLGGNTITPFEAPIPTISGVGDGINELTSSLGPSKGQQALQGELMNTLKTFGQQPEGMQDLLDQKQSALEAQKAFSKEALGVTSQLDTLRKGIKEESGSITQGAANRILEQRGQPLRETLTKLVEGRSLMKEDISDIDNTINSLVSRARQERTDKATALEKAIEMFAGTENQKLVLKAALQKQVNDLLNQDDLESAKIKSQIIMGDLSGLPEQTQLLAVQQAVQNLMSQELFKGVETNRTEQQIVRDIFELVKQGVPLDKAIKENLEIPMRGKPEVAAKQKEVEIKRKRAEQLLSGGNKGSGSGLTEVSYETGENGDTYQITKKNGVITKKQEVSKGTIVTEIIQENGKDYEVTTQDGNIIKKKLIPSKGITVIERVKIGDKSYDVPKVDGVETKRVQVFPKGESNKSIFLNSGTINTGE